MGRWTDEPLSQTHPDLARQANGWDPNEVSAGSNKLMDWKCDSGHTWTAKINNRSHGRGCPFCSNRRILKGFNDLATTHPEIARQASGWDPTTVMAGTGKRLEWICQSGHIWTATGNDRKSGYGCPYCSGRLVVTGESDLQTTHPEIARQLVNADPRKISFGSGKKYKWKCDAGHLWFAVANERTTGNTGCPFCSNRKILKNFNDLATTHPRIASEADGWDPSTVGIGSNKTLKWICPQGHRWKAKVYSRTKSGCPTCANKRVQEGFNDLATTHPAIASEADGWDAREITRGTNRRVKWRCKLGHTWYTTVANRTGKNTTGCPYCSNNKVLPGFNDLRTLFPEIAAQAHNWDPTKVTWGANSRKEWTCEKGHIWRAFVRDRTSRVAGKGCPYCGFKKLLRGFNDLATTHPRIASEADGWDPTQVITNKKTKYSWICSEGHTWKTSITERKTGTNCPTCAVSGFDPNAKGYLYFLSHPGWQMFQIGITNFPEKRVGTHRKLGWELIEIRGPMDGHLAQQWETAILRMLKARGADLANSKIAGKFDGYSEAWSKDLFSAKTIRQLMDLTEHYEKSLKNR